MHDTITPPSLIIRGNCVSQNEYPLGVEPNYQYYRAIAHDMFVGIGNDLSLSVTDKTEDNTFEQKKFIIVEAYCENRRWKKRDPKVKLNTLSPN
jgi:hypothetical protein